MKLTVIGCSGSYPGPDSPASCYLLEAESEGRTWRLLLDLGNGSLGALHRHVDPLQIDGVVLSHLHADHCLDLCGYHVMRRYHPSGRQPKIPVWGPKGTAKRMARAYDLPKDPGMTEEFDFQTLRDSTKRGPVTLGPFTVESVPVRHPVAAYAVRVTADDRCLVYSGDTAPCESLHQIARRADLFLVEASFRDEDTNPPGIHLTGSEAGEVATRADVRRVLLTHVPPWHDPDRALVEARRTYSGPLALAEAGTTYEV